MLAVIFVGRQCWLVCRGSRQCRPTNLAFNFTYLLFFCRFLSKAVTFCREISHIYRWTSCYPVYRSNMTDFSCVDFCRAMLCISAAYAVTRCLCVCFCVSVCLSRSCIVSKRIKISSIFFHDRVATPF